VVALCFRPVHPSVHASVHVCKFVGGIFDRQLLPTSSDNLLCLDNRKNIQPVNKLAPVIHKDSFFEVARSDPCLPLKSWRFLPNRRRVLCISLSVEWVCFSNLHLFRRLTVMCASQWMVNCSERIKRVGLDNLSWFCCAICGCLFRFF